MQRFDSDYMEGAHPNILRRLQEMNLDKQPGYGSDKICARAKEKIRLACACPQAEVHFLVGGTQMNKTVISAMLRPCEGVLAAETGHISVHEAGAVEYTGHKGLTLPQQEGKVCAEDLKRYLETFYGDDNHEHMVWPGMLYLSHPTEFGTLYTREELTGLRAVCDEYQLPLYLDGARLGYALAARETDVTLPILASLCDAFYIGGTKVGALFGEALVVTRASLLPRFFTTIKQHGALLAKGWLLGVQFDELFTEDLYWNISRHAICMAEKLKAGFAKKGYAFYLDSPTNQQFIILDNEKKEELSQQVSFSFWEKYDDSHTVVRFATSWATTEEDVDALLALL